MSNIEKNYISTSYTQVFSEKFVINEDINLLLNSISVYGLVDNFLGEKVDFEIKVINGKKIIYPWDNNYDTYVLFCEKMGRRNLIKMNSDGDVEFTIQEG